MLAKTTPSSPFSKLYHFPEERFPRCGNSESDFDPCSNGHIRKAVEVGRIPCRRQQLPSIVQIKVSQKISAFVLALARNRSKTSPFKIGEFVGSTIKIRIHELLPGHGSFIIHFKSPFCVASFLMPRNIFD